ncbi:MAG: XRE family transcriptional regulator [Lachnospiraceae bacterium]|nr:XRE family transcriptional regulator [Lachnospiraceae bacterium]
MSEVAERIIMVILADIREPKFGLMCRIVVKLGICVHELRTDEEQYVISVQKATLAGMLVISEINSVKLEKLIHIILKKGIEEKERNIFSIDRGK